MKFINYAKKLVSLSFAAHLIFATSAPLHVSGALNTGIQNRGTENGYRVYAFKHKPTNQNETVTLAVFGRWRGEDGNYAHEKQPHIILLNKWNRTSIHTSETEDSRGTCVVGSGRPGEPVDFRILVEDVDQATNCESACMISVETSHTPPHNYDIPRLIEKFDAVYEGLSAPSESWREIRWDNVPGRTSNGEYIPNIHDGA
jgi:hypothetical protein